jgi:hypothetical protein
MISSELVRQNWNLFPDILNETQIYHENFYESFWDRWYSKFSMVRSNTLMKLLKDFITNNDKIEMIDTIENTDNNLQRTIINNKPTLILRGLSNYSRSEYQKLCDKIGLHHTSFSLTNFVGYRENETGFDLHITKPTTWAWEWTTTNPFPYYNVYIANPCDDTSNRL